MTRSDSNLTEIVPIGRLRARSEEPTQVHLAALRIVLGRRATPPRSSASPNDGLLRDLREMVETPTRVRTERRRGVGSLLELALIAALLLSGTFLAAPERMGGIVEAILQAFRTLG